MSKETWAIVGVIVGWVLTSITEAIRRRGDRKDRAQQIVRERGEAILQYCTEAFEWVEVSRSSANAGASVSLPLWSFRILAHATLYFPSLSAYWSGVSQVAWQYRTSLVELVEGARGKTVITEAMQAESAKYQSQLRERLNDFWQRAAADIRLQISPPTVDQMQP
jgi:hypothetical protein